MIYNKEKEIKIIKDLCEMDGYFAEHFKEDLNKMIENIKNDHPIDLGTKATCIMWDLEKKLEKTIKDHTCEILALCTTMLLAHIESGNERLYVTVVEKIGLKETIALKRALGLNVTNDEIDYLLKQIN